MVITLLAGGHLVIAHRISVGDFVEFNTYMILLIWPIIAVAGSSIFFRGAPPLCSGSMNCSRPSAIDDRAADKSVGADSVLRGEIEFRHLDFSYGETPVLRDISLKIPAGSSLAIVARPVPEKHTGQPSLATL